MPLTAAEKQQRYRERHLGVHGAKDRIQLFISVQAKAQLGRLARHHGYTVTKVIETLDPEDEAAILDKAYVGLPKDHPHHRLYLPYKATRGHPLTELLAGPSAAEAAAATSTSQMRLNTKPPDHLPAFASIRIPGRQLRTGHAGHSKQQDRGLLARWHKNRKRVAGFCQRLAGCIHQLKESACGRDVNQTVKGNKKLVISPARVSRNDRGGLKKQRIRSDAREALAAAS